MPGIGATTLLDSSPGPCSCAGGVDVGRRLHGSGAGKLRRKPPRQTGSGSRAGGAESGGYSTRNAVVACAGAEHRVRDEPAQEREVRGHAGDLGRRERGGKPVERLVARVAGRDQLRDHRVVAGPDLVAFLDAGVDAHRGGQAQALDASRLRQERPRVLGVEPHLDGVAVQRRGLTSSRSPRAIRSCHWTRSTPVTASVTGCSTWMRPFSSRKKNSRPSTTNSAVPARAIADRAREADRSVAHLRAQVGVQRR